MKRSLLNISDSHIIGVKSELKRKQQEIIEFIRNETKNFEVKTILFSELEWQITCWLLYHCNPNDIAFKFISKFNERFILSNLEKKKDLKTKLKFFSSSFKSENWN